MVGTVPVQGEPLSILVGKGASVIEPRYVVGAHETFAFRTGWLKKGYDAVREDGFAFNRDDAVVRLGVGKNMVRSIRFWCLATRMLEEEHRTVGGNPLKPTALGNKLLAEDGWDPYLEDPASLWLLHWLLVTNPLRASAWWYIFGKFPDNEFTKDRLTTFLQSIVEEQHQSVSPASIARDVDCFVRTYTPSTHGGTFMPEASFDCPLAELELIYLTGTDSTYRFRVGKKETLPIHVVGFALLQFFQSHAPQRRSIGVRECLYMPASPGQAFRLDEDSLLTILEELSSLTRGMIRVSDTAGIAQVFLDMVSVNDLSRTAMQLLDEYYREGKGYGA